MLNTTQLIRELEEHIGLKKIYEEKITNLLKDKGETIYEIEKTILEKTINRINHSIDTIRSEVKINKIKKEYVNNKINASEDIKEKLYEEFKKENRDHIINRTIREKVFHRSNNAYEQKIMELQGKLAEHEHSLKLVL